MDSLELKASGLTGTFGPSPGTSVGFCLLWRLKHRSHIPLRLKHAAKQRWDPVYTRGRERGPIRPIFVVSAAHLKQRPSNRSFPSWSLHCERSLPIFITLARFFSRSWQFLRLSISTCPRISTGAATSSFFGSLSDPNLSSTRWCFADWLSRSVRVLGPFSHVT